MLTLLIKFPSAQPVGQSPVGKMAAEDVWEKPLKLCWTGRACQRRTHESSRKILPQPLLLRELTVPIERVANDAASMTITSKTIGVAVG
jgi:hypothetical protein